MGKVSYNIVNVRQAMCRCMRRYPQAAPVEACTPFCSDVVEKLKNWSNLLDAVQRFYLVSCRPFIFVLSIHRRVGLDKRLLSVFGAAG